MRELIYSMGVSLDGFIAGPGGDIGYHLVELPARPAAPTSNSGATLLEPGPRQGGSREAG